MEMFEFNREIIKISSCFPKSLNDTKTNIIFSKLEKLSGHQFAQVCDKIVNSFKYAPSISDFLEISQEFKSPNVEIVPLTHEEWKKENPIFSDEERMEMLGFMKKCAMGLVKKSDAELYAKTVQSVINERSKIQKSYEKHFTCGKCEDGILMTERKDSNANPFAFRCSCDLGHKRKESWPIWEERHRFQFIEIPQHGPSTSA